MGLIEWEIFGLILSVCAAALSLILPETAYMELPELRAKQRIRYGVAQ